MLYFCHVCEEQTEVLVNRQPVCLICQSEFVEEIDSIQNDSSFDAWYQPHQLEYDVGGSWPESSSTIESEYDAYDYPGLCATGNSSPDPYPYGDDDQETQYSDDENGGSYFNHYDGESVDSNSAYDPYDYDGYASFHEEDQQVYGSTDEEEDDDVIISQVETDEPTSERSWYTYYEEEGPMLFNTTDDMGQEDPSHQPNIPYYSELYDPYVENDFPDSDSFATPEEDTGTDGEDDHPHIDSTSFVSDDEYHSGSTNYDNGNNTYEDNDVDDNGYDAYDEPLYPDDDYNDAADATIDLAQLLENAHISYTGWQYGPDDEEYHDPEGEEWDENSFNISYSDAVAHGWGDGFESDQRVFQEAYDIPNILRMINEEHQNDPSWDSPTTEGASPAEIDLLPRRLLNDKDSKEVIESECSICQDIFGTELHLIRLPCQHEYHAICIEQWLLRNATCPICRSQVIVWNSSC
ncbi:hypothetical protein K492DRAFT_203151 [Lichtheimia hyalospora FSU 10163]|nr:hypothetical protein K492DRAFT_203151 [Lichtheimia hyalospora FSU 10163]